MAKKSDDSKIPYVIIPFGILMGFLLILILYAYVFENRLPNRFELQVFGLVTGILFAIMGVIGVYFRDLGKYVKGRPAIVIGIFIIVMGIMNIVCYWSAIFG